MAQSIWVEILPNDWPDWRDRPYSFKVGRVFKRRPKPHEIARFRQVYLSVDMDAMFGPLTARGER